MKKRRSLVWVVALIGSSLLALWLLRPFIATIVHNNVGSIRLNRALLSPDPDPTKRTVYAVKAGRAFQTSLAWHPRNGQAYYNLAAVYELRQDHVSATRALSQAAASSPDDPTTRFRLGTALATQGREEEAIEEWQAAGAAPYFVNQGLALVGEGNLDSAVEQYERALTIDPNLAEGHYRLSEALTRLGRKEEALAALELAAALEPASSPRRYLLQADVHTARGEWEEALANLERAADLAPWDHEPHYDMARILVRLGDREAAIVRLQRALHLKPDHTLSRLTLAQIYEEERHCEEVAASLSPLLGSDVESVIAAKAHELLGSCLLGTGQIQEGLSHLEHAVALAPRSTRRQLMLAQGYVQAGRHPDAIEVYSEVLEIEPENAEAQRALEELEQSEKSDDGP